jgi:hypothetical protein
MMVTRNMLNAGAIHHQADLMVCVGDVALVDRPPRLSLVAIKRSLGQDHGPIGVIERRELRASVREDRLPDGRSASATARAPPRVLNRAAFAGRAW